MRIISIAIGFAVAPLICAAQPTSTNTTDNTRFLVCYNGEAASKIEGLEPANRVPRHHQEIRESVDRRLQTYFYLLSGCKIPIENVDPPPKEKPAYTIHVDVGPPTDHPYARIDIHRTVQPYTTPLLYIEDEEFGRGLKEADAKTAETEKPRVFLRQALDAFGQRYFGVPVSAIDDTNFDWSAHHTNTLAISYADFQPIRFGPGP
jgi:hypothetical protein